MQYINRFLNIKIKKKFPVFLGMRIGVFIIGGLMLFSCKDDTPYIAVPNTIFPKIPTYLLPPKSQGIQLNFSHFFWNDSIKGLDQNYQLDSSSQYSFKFTNIKYLISKIELKTTSGNWCTFPNQYGLVNLYLGADSFFLKEVPNGVYSHLRFQIGLDSLENHGDPLRWPKYHPLDPSYCQMHWGWQGGYIFHATEGKLIRNGQETGFSFHLGGIINRTTVEIPIPSISVNNSVEKLKIKHDLHRVYFGQNPIDLQKNPLSSHSENDTVFISKLKGNLPGSFQAY